jgi:FSR family fosmidomycin resistance protein-like MFS transporter
MSQGAIPALLPFLIDSRGYSYAAASALVLASTVSSSVVQPLFGLWSDRVAVAWVIPLGVLLSGAGLAGVGVAPSYELTLLAVLVSGLGVAAFHPEGSRFANFVSGRRRATGMARFGVGGNLGFALGPILTTPTVLALGLSGTVFLALPAVLCAAVLLRELPRLRGFAPGAAEVAEGDEPAEGQQWGAFSLLGGVILVRTFFYFGLSTFVALYFVAELDASKAEANTALAVLLFAGALGTVAGGPLADRYGRRAFLLGTTVVLTPLAFAFLASGPLVGIALLALIGAATISTFSLTTLMGQEYLPGRIGLASGVTLGLAIGLGGVGAGVFGLLADRVGLRVTLEIVALLPVVALPFVLALPRHTRAEAREREGAVTEGAGA